MKIVEKNGRVYVRRWFRWYYLEGMLVFRLDFKAADDDDE